jgi:outer membrane murein-binding lipoprotein Lpp
MKRPRAPFAKRSVWIAVAILAALLVIGGAIAGYEINHLHNQVNQLQSQVTLLFQAYLQKGK